MRCTISNNNLLNIFYKDKHSQFLSLLVFFLFENVIEKCRSPPIFNFFEKIGGKLVNRPKRRKHKDNPYTLAYTINERYVVVFKDGKNVSHEVEVTEEVYNAFNDFELRDLSELNEYDNHIEHSIIYEETLHRRTIIQQESIDDYIIKKATYEELINAIKTLPEIQQRRIKKYYFDEKNELQIAREENVSQKNVSKSLAVARENLGKILKNKI